VCLISISFSPGIKYGVPGIPSKNFHKIGPAGGISQRKRRALHEWALYTKSNNVISSKWKVMPLAEYRREICGVWGFGRWSADMIAIFHLGRMDIWPENDKGIKKSCKVVFGHIDYFEIKKHIAGSETLAALYLWELLNKNLLEDFEKTCNG
jgi:DNA-3-methyladenine glycosylase II